jgi:hydroxypyruvate isomerase
VRYSACIEWLFATEALDVADRIRAAQAAGLDAVEFWRFSNKDIDAVAAALAETGLPLACMLCEPVVPLTDPGAHDEFLAGLARSLQVAQRLGAPVLIAQAGDEIAGVARTVQHAAIVKVLAEAAEVLEGSGVRLALEPLNDRVDHPGYYLTSTVEGLDIIDEVNRPEIKLLYDIYHSAVMGESIAAVLDGRVDRIVHVHLADAPGRGEPGSGTLDYEERLDWLEAAGYSGYVGLEYRPSRGTSEGLTVLGAGDSVSERR